MPAKMTHRGRESPMLNLNSLPLQSAFGLIIRRMKMLSFVVQVMTRSTTEAIRQIHGLYRLFDRNTRHVSLFCDPLLKALNPKIPRLFAKRRIQRIIKTLGPSPENGRQGPYEIVGYMSEQVRISIDEDFVVHLGGATDPLWREKFGKVG
jgi:hypothetical protein